MDDFPFPENYEDEINDYVFNFVGADDFDGQTIEGFSFPVQFDVVKTGFIQDNYDRGEWDHVEQELHFFGRGTDGYIIEPQITCANGVPGIDYWNDVPWMWKLKIDAPFYFPAVEINVTVQVKLKSLDLPIILSRIYLPDYQYLQIQKREEAKVYEVIDRIMAKKNLSPKTKGHTQSYDFQAARINKCFKLLFGYSR